MEKEAAQRAYDQLEAVRDTEFEGDPPTYDVRLSAGIKHETGDRSYMVRVTGSQGVWTRDAMLYVCEVAAEQDAEVDVQNNGVELR